jgi:hypothetical protein
MIRFANEESEKAFSFACALADFRYTIKVKGKILIPLFEQMQLAGAAVRAKREEMEEWSDLRMLDEVTNKDGRERLQRHQANKAIYEDSGAAIALLLLAEMERFFKMTGVRLYERGQESYVPGLKFSRALSHVANQFKHLGSWRDAPEEDHPGLSEVTKLVDNALRTDAASEFFLRCCFADYDSLQRAVLSCSGDLVDMPLVVDDEGELPTVKLQYRKQQPHEADSAHSGDNAP